MPTLYAKPAYGKDTAKERASRHVRKHLFKPVEEVGEITLVYAPFYPVEGEYMYIEERGVLFTREYKVRLRVRLLALANGLPPPLRRGLVRASGRSITE